MRDHHDDPELELGSSSGSAAFIEELKRCRRWVGERWRRHERDELAFAEIAAEALASVADDGFSIESIVRWAIEAERLPLTGGDDGFGEPSLTVMFGEGFKIDLLFWSHGTTSIHQHMFAGAFKVLQGTSVHCTYRFECGRRVNSRLRLGRLCVDEAELLRPGQIRAIAPGPAFTHAVLHLGRPSVTLLVRTAGEDDFRPQYEYLFPGIALDPVRVNPTLRKQLGLLTMMLRTGQSGFAAAAEQFLARASLEAFVRVLKHDPLLEAPGFFERYERAARRFEHAQLLVEGYRRVQRDRALFTWCRRAPSMEHRFFLAALCNVAAAQPLADVIAEETKGDPVELGLRWFDELIEIQKQSRHMPVLVELHDVDEARARLRKILQGRPDAPGGTPIGLVRPFEIGAVP